MPTHHILDHEHDLVETERRDHPGLGSQTVIEHCTADNCEYFIARRVSAPTIDDYSEVSA